MDSGKALGTTPSTAWLPAQLTPGDQVTDFGTANSLLLGQPTVLGRSFSIYCSLRWETLDVFGQERVTPAASVSHL